LKRLALIGPVLPFRGGVAQHTTMLQRALPDLSKHLTISFTRQYPTLIFPGENDRDPAYEGHREPGVEYLIDSLNPLSWRKAVQRVLAFNADIVVIPWWTAYWAPCFAYIAKTLRRKGLVVVFVCHNVFEHESTAWKIRLTKWVLSQGSRFVVHTREDAANLETLVTDAVISVHPHPIYDQFPAPKGELDSRGDLDLLFYGFVRPYKGLDLLIEAMAKTKANTYLTIAGEFWDGEERVRRRIKALGLGDRTELRPRYHTDQETAELFARSDIIVLPYRSATGSGVVPVAYHYDKPVIVTRVGGLPDVVDDGKTGKLIEPDNIDALAEAINSLTRGDAAAMVPAIQALKRSMTWVSLASTCLGGH
jgi:glycosyltransferase involved in cell wall biosynthesis